MIAPDTKKKLDDAIKAAEEANKPVTDPESPQTGDNSHMGLWFALILGSLAAMFAILFSKKKSKIETK